MSDEAESLYRRPFEPAIGRHPPNRPRAPDAPLPLASTEERTLHALEYLAGCMGEMNALAHRLFNERKD